MNLGSPIVCAAAVRTVALEMRTLFAKPAATVKYRKRAFALMAAHSGRNGATVGAHTSRLPGRRRTATGPR